jgi:hypothetical protein
MPFFVAPEDEYQKRAHGLVKIIRELEILIISHGKMSVKGSTCGVPGYVVCKTNPDRLVNLAKFGTFPRLYVPGTF